MVSSSDLETIRELLRSQPDANRTEVARALCERWQWRTPRGTWKVRSATGVLTELERRGCLVLPIPPARAAALSAAVAAPSADWDPKEPLPLTGAVREYRPLCWELVLGAAGRRQWRELLDRHHYLGAPRLVGPSLRYLIYSRQGEWLGAMGWHAAVRHLGCRDRLIGWDSGQRAAGLARIANCARFLIPPWVRVPGLASAMLGESIGHLRRDWLRRHGVALWLAESFVDRARFSGVSYRAANWQGLGWTQGYKKSQGGFIHHGQIKEVYVHVMEKRMRQWVHADPRQPLLTREYLLAQRLSETTKPITRRTRMKAKQGAWTPKLPPQWDLSAGDIERLGQELQEFTALFQPAFRRREKMELLELYMQGLLGETTRKNVEAMALDLEGPGSVRNLQRFITEYKWDEDWMRQRHWQLAAESLSDDQGVWSVDASEFPKKGEASVGVAHQYCGALGKTANCQSGVFICYSSPRGHALLDSRLYLPQDWFSPEATPRREDCRIPADITLQTKPQLAGGLVKDLIASGLFAGRWITFDCSFGNNDDFLEVLPPGYLYLAEIACTRKVWIQSAPKHRKLETEGCTVEHLVQIKGLLRWRNLRINEGEKGPLVAGFARVRVYLDKARTPESERWLVLRNDANGQIKYALSNAPLEIPFEELVRVSGARWPIERCFQEEKSDLGLDHYEHRSWPAWHRHTRLVSLAQLFLLRLRHKFKKKPRP